MGALMSVDRLPPRCQRVIHLLEHCSQGDLNVLSAILSVTPRTVRADLRKLKQAGYQIHLVDGQVFYDKPGVYSRSAIQNPSPSFTLRMHTHAAAKQSIARWAAGLVQDGDVILMDASTTVFYMAECLIDRRRLVVLTNGIDVGRAMAKNPTNTVILVAGVVRQNGASVIGPLYEPVLRKHQIKTAFVSCQGFSLAAGLTERDEGEAMLKHQMTQLADTTVALVDSSKFGQVFPEPFARANQVTHVFSDLRLDPQWSEQLQKSSIVLTLC